MKRESLAPDTGVGSVHLSVTDLDRSVGFYREVVGFRVTFEDEARVVMGADETELITLYPGATRPVAEGTTGLYHLAIVVPNRKELARVIARLMSKRIDNYPTDHLITKSDYLWDPDGNGIEIYVETPEDGTLVIGEDGFYAEDNNGAQRSGRDPIDLESLFAFLTATDRLELPLPHGTKMGHVHLHVRDVNEAVQFWSDIVGFDLMGKSNRFGAAFVSAGGYHHHHLGLNTWAGEARHQHPWVRLDFVTSRLRPTKVDLDFVGNRLRTAGVEITDETESMFLTEDPSGDRVRITVRE